MAIVERDVAGFHNGRATLTVAWDDSFDPPKITELRLQNESIGPVVDEPWLHVRLERPDGTEIATFSHQHNSGVVMTVDVPTVLGDFRMIGSRGSDQTVGYNIPFKPVLWAS